jgi:hypothetical protein
MRAPTCLLILTIPTFLLSACEDGRPPPVAAIRAIEAQPTPEARKAEIRRQLARICPAPLSDVALERAASFIGAHRDKDAVAIIHDLSRLDAETQVCRGIEVR